MHVQLLSDSLAAVGLVHRKLGHFKISSYTGRQI